MTPSWYDVLDVEETATPAEIRTAWKAAIADLDPGDRRFRLANQAAEVLLDPVKREAHDEQLAAEAAAGTAVDAEPTAPADAEPAEPAEPAVPASKKSGTKSAKAAAPVVEDALDDEEDDDEDLDDDHDRDADDDEQDDDVAHDERRGPGLAALPKAVLALAAVALVLVVLTVVALVQGGDGGDGAGEDGGLPTTRQVEDARGAAEAAVVPVLSYDYRSLGEDQAEARTYLTEEYAKEYDRFFAAAVETNAPRTKTVVRVRVLDSAIVRTGQDRVDVLLFVNRPTTNAQRSVEYRDQVTMRMLDVDGTWLVDCMITTGTGPCEGDDG